MAGVIGDVEARSINPTIRYRSLKDSSNNRSPIRDLVKIAGAIAAAAAAPTIYPHALATLTTADVQQWLLQAQQFNLTDPASQRGIRFLEQLLIALTPKETALLPNYPNPFNPETWIPYQLAEPAEVTLTIYAVDGTVTRTLITNCAYELNIFGLRSFCICV